MIDNIIMIYNMHFISPRRAWSNLQIHDKYSLKISNAAANMITQQTNTFA